jgi:hypothetical protein
MRRLAFYSFLFALPFVNACSPSLDACTTELRTEVQPRDIRLNVSESVQASVELSTCGGKQKLSDIFTWASQNERVATVEASTGLVTALSVGETVIKVTGKDYGDIGAINVSIIAEE